MTTTRTSPTVARRAYSVLVGLASLAVLLQGLWAGLFVREGQGFDDHWVEVHARGADIAIVLAALATLVAFARLRERRDLVIGTAAFTVLLILEAYLGGLIGKHPGATIVHIPLAMGLMALAVWLPMRTRR